MNLKTFALVAATLGATAAQAQTVTVMGSTALGPLMKRAAEMYMKSHAGVQIAISGGGSMTGLNQIAAGNCTIGISDVYATPDQEKAGIQNNDIVIEPFTLVVNPSVSVRNLSAQQAEAVFTGAVSNWNQVGGPDMKVIRINRPESSGTRAVQQKTVLGGKPFSSDQLIMDSTGAVLTAATTTKGAVCFIELDFAEKNKGKVEAVSYNGAFCTPENVKAGKYPLFSYGHAYINPAKTDAPTLAVAQDFLKFITSQTFQDDVVPKAGYMQVSLAAKLKTKL
ncbi:MAG TPA: substrate-binding domain-containing protein [Holophagaceae bacterium]|jgi:phosphate transport system substrate-binding protein|nr:substrate-binding domain-containing protein [Holophagaceae bacterium]